MKELGLTNKTEIEETLLYWCTQEFFLGEITKQELDEYADEIGYQIHLSLFDEGEESLC